MQRQCQENQWTAMRNQWNILTPLPGSLRVIPLVGQKERRREGRHYKCSPPYIQLCSTYSPGLGVNISWKWTKLAFPSHSSRESRLTVLVLEPTICSIFNLTSVAMQARIHWSHLTTWHEGFRLVTGVNRSGVEVSGQKFPKDSVAAKAPWAEERMQKVCEG